MTTEIGTSPAAVVQAGFEAFARGDVPGFAAMFHPNATWNHRNDDALGGIHHGIDAILAFLAASGERTAGTLRAVPLAIMTGDEGRVAVQVHVSATRPDGRTHDDMQVLLFMVDGERVRSVDQYIGDPAVVTAFWA